MMGRKRSNVLDQTMILATDVSSSMVMKMTPLAEPGRWRMVTRPETVTRAPEGLARKSSLRMRPRRARPGEVGAQERCRMRAQRQLEKAVVVDDLLAQRHERKRDGRFGRGLRLS